MRAASGAMAIDSLTDASAQANFARTQANHKCNCTCAPCCALDIDPPRPGHPTAALSEFPDMNPLISAAVYVSFVRLSALLAFRSASSFLSACLGLF